MIYCRYNGVKIAYLKKSGSFCFSHKGRDVYTPHLADAVKFLSMPGLERDRLLAEGLRLIADRDIANWRYFIKNYEITKDNIDVRDVLESFYQCQN